MTWYILLICLLLKSSTAGLSYRSYSGYKVYRSVQSSDEKQKLLEDQVESGGCEMLKVSHKSGRPSDFMCSPTVSDRLVRELGVEVETLIDDMGDLVKEQARGRRVRRQTEGVMDWDSYQRYETIVKWMEGLAANNEFVTLEEMGRSHENRSILMLKVGKSPAGNSTRAVWVDGGIHAREWIAVSTATYLLDQVVRVFRDNDTSTCEAHAVQAVDWYFAPLLNPDGYEFTHTNDRMWRKNRSPPPAGSSCVGTDLNRNWDVIGFGAGATSSNPCKETYKGTEKNSEPETQAISETIMKYKDNVRVYLSFHSYGQYWLNSWGYKTQLAVDNEKLEVLGRQAVDAINCINPDRSYTIGSAGAIFYIAGGASDDYAKATAEIPYSFTVELPDTGNYGFLLPADQIKQVGKELWAAAGEIAKEAGRHPLGADPARDLEKVADKKLGLNWIPNLN